ncbi:MAG: PTS transporter subunit EIIC [Candidatus Eremiobacteraeota bacterium]|nr:PTS transporter subunit EIIC [Candidatus Eremiobacteraeota bacterium]
MSEPAPGGLAGTVAALELRLFPILRRWADEPHLLAVRDAVQISFYAFGAWTVVAFFLLPPGPLLERFFQAYHIGFGFMGVALAIVLPDRLAVRLGYNRVAAIAIGLGAFLLSMPPNVLHQHFEDFLGAISATSLFLALLIGLTTGEFMRIACQKIEREWVASVMAALASVVVFGGLAALHVDIATRLVGIVQPLVSVGDTLPALLIVVFLQTMLWSAGIHGPAFLAALTTPIYLHALDVNAQAIVHHQHPPYVVTLMIFTFIYPGGSGATLPLAFLLLRSKVQRLRRLGLASLAPSIFNVNEPLIFGIPVVMNPGLVLPFVGIPLVLATITFIALSIGLVDRTSVWLPGAIPSFIAAWLTTKGDWRSLVLSALNIVVAFLLWTPFFRVFERTISGHPETEEELVKAAKAIREHERAEQLNPDQLKQRTFRSANHDQ